MLGQMCKRAGLGSEPRKALDEIAQIKAVDVVMPTKQGTVIRNRCIAQPTKAQAVLLQRLQSGRLSPTSDAGGQYLRKNAFLLSHHWCAGAHFG